MNKYSRYMNSKSLVKTSEIVLSSHITTSNEFTSEYLYGILERCSRFHSIVQVYASYRMKPFTRCSK